MTLYPDSDNAVQLVKEAADIVQIIGEHVNLKKAGVNYKGLCPFHAEKTPSFQVNPARRTFHCFGCGEGGDALAFMMKYHHLSFAETLKDLARRYHIDLPEKPLSPADEAKARQRQTLFEINEKAAAIFHDHLLLHPAAEPARRYLQGRGLDLDTIKSFRLGYAPNRWDFLSKSWSREASLEPAIEVGLVIRKDDGDCYDRFRDRVLFPILNLTGKVAGFGGRILGEGKPKYLNSPESPVFDKSRILFGLYQNREAIRTARKCLLVEGNFDLVSLVLNGVKNVVAPLGTALTQSHVRLLKGYVAEVILLFDGDAAGLQAAMRAVPLFLNEQLDAKIVVLPANHDPDSYVREHGRQGLEHLVGTALLLSEFVLSRLVEQHGLTLEGKARIINELRPLVAAIGDRQLQRTMFVSHFSQKLGLTPEQLLQTVPVAAPAPAVARPRQQTPAAMPEKKIDLPKEQEPYLEFLIIYPEYLQDFIDAGLLEVITDPAGVRIISLLHDIMLTAGEEYAPEHLLNHVAGAEKSFISRLLVAAPAYDDEMKTAVAGEMLAWLAQTSGKKKRAVLSRRISEAQQANDEEQMMNLIAEMKKMNEKMTVGG